MGGCGATPVQSGAWRVPGRRRARGATRGMACPGEDCEGLGRASPPAQNLFLRPETWDLGTAQMMRKEP